MIKKILINIVLWLSFTGSTLASDVSFTSLYGSNHENNIHVGTGIIYDDFRPNKKDWIGIYKAGDSSAWENVKLWTWARNLKPVEDGYGDRYYEFTNINLPSGQYEVRYFLNNTFIPRLTSKPFIVSTDEIKAYYSTKNKSLNIEIRDKNFNPNPKDWIGVYKKDTTNNWKNVREWIWAKDLKKNPNNFYEYQFNNSNLTSGTYEVRYFLNNTYTTHKQSKPFNVQVSTSDELYGSHSPHHKSTYIEIRNENFNPNPKDWFGVYKVGDSNNWENVKEWIWAKDLQKSPPGYYHQFENSDLDSCLWGQEFEVRYFLNNTYIANKTSKPFKCE